MGNKSSLPANEAIYHAAKNGRHVELEAMLRNVTPEARASDLLEWQDEEGRTALIVAAAKGHVKCVDLLVRYRANVQHMSRRKNEGGTALHEAVFRQTNRAIVETLLRYGASPFVENLSKFTALDYAIVRRDAGVIRRLERHGYFSNYMRVRVRKNFGLSKTWAPKWISIVPRYGCPLKSEDRQTIRRVMLIYNDARCYEPICKVYLDGASAREVVGNNGMPLALLTLHPTHVQPKGVHSQRGTAGGWMMNFMQFSTEPEQLQSFLSAVELRNEVPVQPLSPNRGGEALSPQANFQNAPPVIHERQQSLPSRPSQGPAEPGSAHPAPIEEVEDEEDDVENLASAPPMPPEFEGWQDPNSAQNQAANFEVLGQDSINLDDDDLCVVCLSNPRTCGFVHGNSIHRCVCQECAVVLQQSGDGLCPICRQRIEHVITSFY